MPAEELLSREFGQVDALLPDSLLRHLARLSR